MVICLAWLARHVTQPPLFSVALCMAIDIDAHPVRDCQ